MKIGKQIVVSTTVNFLMFLLGFVSVKILTNTLSVSNYGVYSLIFATIGILSLIFNFGFFKYLVVKIPGEDKSKGFSYFTSIFIFESIFIIIFNILVIGIGAFLVKYSVFNNTIFGIVVFSAFILMFEILAEETLRFHSLRKRLELTSLMSLLKEKFWILPLLFIWWSVGKISLSQILLIRLFPLILVLFISFWAMKKEGEKIGDNKILDKKIIYDGFVFGAPLIILGFGDMLLISADRYIIALFISTAAVAYYSLVYSLITIAYGLTASIHGVSFYHFAEAYNLRKEDNFQFCRAKDILNCSLKLSLIVSFFLCVIFIFLRFSLIQIVSNREYLIAAPTMLILSLFPPLLIINNLLQGLLVLEKQSRILIKGYILAPLLNIILNFILIPIFGINGAAITTVISYFALFLFFLPKVKKYQVLEFPKSQLFKSGIALFLAAIPLYLLKPVSLIELFYSGIISGLIYLASLIILKVINKKDWNILWAYEKPI